MSEQGLEQRNQRTVRKLVLGAVAMFGFAFAIDHKAQTVQALLAASLSTLRVLFVLGQVGEEGALPTGFGGQLRRGRTRRRLGGFLRWRLSRLSIGRFLL